jgi:hypothetical protein
MKRNFRLLICLLMALSMAAFSGCGSGEEEPETDDAPAATSNQAAGQSAGQGANQAAPGSPGATNATPASGSAKPTSTATFRAEPNPIQVCDNSGSGKTTLVWDVKGTHRVQVRVGTPDGGVMADSSQAQGRAETGNWVTDGAKFFLQDASGPRPTTLASVTVRVTKDGCR